jgi:hypothetical protein
MLCFYLSAQMSSILQFQWICGSDKEAADWTLASASARIIGLTCFSHQFSELHHQTPYMFVRPHILMPRDVSDCEILCYNLVVISMMALLEPSRFILFYSVSHPDMSISISVE